MKVNHMSDVVKILIIAATTIITCVIVALGFLGLNTARQISNTAIGQMSELNSELKDSGIMQYNKEQVKGSEVINFIKKYLGDYETPDIAPVYVYVHTDKAENTYYNGDCLTNIRDFTNPAFIKPNALFLGDVDKNENGVVVGVRFMQQ
jgi:hypothetical protein